MLISIHPETSLAQHSVSGMVLTGSWPFQATSTKIWVCQQALPSACGVFRKYLPWTYLGSVFSSILKLWVRLKPKRRQQSGFCIHLLIYGDCSSQWHTQLLRYIRSQYSTKVEIRGSVAIAMRWWVVRTRQTRGLIGFTYGGFASVRLLVQSVRWKQSCYFNKYFVYSLA